MAISLVFVCSNLARTWLTASSYPPSSRALKGTERDMHLMDTKVLQMKMTWIHTYTPLPSLLQKFYEKNIPSTVQTETKLMR